MKSYERVYPEQYLLIEHCASGEDYIIPIADNEPLDLETLVDKWIESHWCGELKRDGDITRKLQGDYYAVIKTDGRKPEDIVCWDGGGFYMKQKE